MTAPRAGRQTRRALHPAAGTGRRRRRFAVPVAGSLAGLVALPLAVSAADTAAAATAARSRTPSATTRSAAADPVKILRDIWGDPGSDDASKGSDGRYDAAKDPGSLYTLTRSIGARDVWTRRDAKGRAVTGQGVTVALLDSGVVPVPGLATPGKLTVGPDLSLENQAPTLLGLDSYGHGTHMAGIIAGADSVPKTAAATPSGDPKDFAGVAPGAGLLGLKLATADGSTDVSQVVAALDWVSQHRTDNGMNVRVVNLSFGTDSLQPAQLDPLAAAAENAWRRGLVVVVSGGNDGAGAGHLTDPAIDPYVIAVGASDAKRNVLGWSSPAVADFSSVGNATRSVDLLAPGTSVASLRDPGSAVDTDHPEGRVAGDATGRLFRGSGTSQAAAVVSGAAALLLQANPALTPDQVKAALTATAHPLPGVPAVAQGAGEIDVAAAVRASTPLLGQPADPRVRLAAQRTTPATGAGSLDAARGGNDLVDPSTGAVLSGERDAQGLPFSSAAWAKLSAAGTAWSGGTWNGAPWTGDGWVSGQWGTSGTTVTRWKPAPWTSASWARARWSDASWSRARWSGDGWSSAGWERARWSSAGWDSLRWKDASWADAS